jgi:hypothetical protein
MFVSLLIGSLYNNQEKYVGDKCWKEKEEKKGNFQNTEKENEALVTTTTGRY